MPPPTGGNSRHVQFAASNMLHHHSEGTTAHAPLGVSGGAARSPHTSGGSLSSPEVFTFAEVDIASQKFGQLGPGGRSFQYPAGEAAAQRSGEEAGGGRHVHFQEEVRSAGVMRGEPPRSAYPLFGSNYSTIV